MVQDATGIQLAVDVNGRVTITNANPPGAVVKKPSLKKVLQAIIGDVNHLVQLNLGRWGNVFMDRFRDGKVDMDDLEALPDTPAPPPPGSNALCKVQVIAHILDEYYFAAKTQQPYRSCHVHGIISENDARKDDGGIGLRVYDDNTFITEDGPIGARVMHLHYFAPDPTDPSKMVEVYREDIPLDATEDDIAGPITRTLNPPNPIRIPVLIPPWLQNLLRFVGRIIGVGNVSQPVWSGWEMTYQPVTYQVLSILQGSYNMSQIVVDQPIVYGSPDADPNTPQLLSSTYYSGNIVTVDANSTGLNDPATNLPVYEANSPTMPMIGGVGGISTPVKEPAVGNHSLSVLYVGLTWTITGAIVATAIYANRIRRRKEL
jgi:hypothetical protein